MRDRGDQIQKTILEAGRAHVNRSLAKQELDRIEQEEEKHRCEFRNEYSGVQKDIRSIRKFREFLKQRQNEYLKVQNIQREILQKRELIAEKEKVNRKVLAELVQTQKQEARVSSAFAQLKEFTGVKNSEELFELFLELKEKARTLRVFKAELETDIAGLDEQTSDKRHQVELFEWRSKESRVTHSQ